MYLSNKWLAEAAADARIRGSQYTTYFDILVSRLHEFMHYNSARNAAEDRVQEALKRVAG
jgi:hypothetical protein